MEYISETMEIMVKRTLDFLQEITEHAVLLLCRETSTSSYEKECFNIAKVNRITRFTKLITKPYNYGR